MKDYLNIIDTLARHEGYTVNPELPDSKLPGILFDATLNNIIIDAQDGPRLIDKEWQINGDLELGHLVFRTLINLISPLSQFGKPAQNDVPMTRANFVRSVLQAVGLKLSENDYDRYLTREAIIQGYIRGWPTSIFTNWVPEGLLPMQNLYSQVTELAESINTLTNDLSVERHKTAILDSELNTERNKAAILEKTLADRDFSVQRLTTLLYEKRAHLPSFLLQARAELAEAQYELAEAQQELRSIKSSTMWRSLEPARKIAALMTNRQRQQVRKVAKLLWWIATPHKILERLRHRQTIRRRLTAEHTVSTGTKAADVNRPNAVAPTDQE
jgi:hypothetical protein